jgi:DNA-binding NtrC family response regulator
MPISVLVADDDEAIRELLTDFLADKGYEVDQAGDGRTVLKKLEKNMPDALLLDNKLPDMDGLGVLKQMKNDGLDTPTIVMTAHGTSSIAIQSIQLGAYDYLTKPLDLDKVHVTLQRLLEHQRLTKQLARYEDRAAAAVDITERIVGTSEQIQEVFKVIGRVAESDAAVLIMGETGTGKELVAQTIFQHSARRTGPFVRVNCAALPETLLESELFGHEKGAFTGAVEMRKGRFELANGGTIFLDEIGEMTASTQRKLLRVLQSGEFQRVGGSKDIEVDVRVIAATNKNLTKEVDAGNFREDLFYRLNVITIVLPPLRDRVGDIPPLVAHFLDKFRYRQEMQPSRIVDEAMDILQHHTWPGNVRELENTIRRAVIYSGGNAITPEHLELDNARAPYLVDLTEAVREGRTLGSVIAEVEREMIRLAMIQANQDEAEAARLLGVSPEEWHQ